MEEGAGADHFGLFHQSHAAIADRLVEALDVFEAAVGERLVDELPEMLGRLQFGAVSGLEDQPDSFGHIDVFRTVPAGLIDLQHEGACRGRPRPTWQNQQG